MTYVETAIGDFPLPPFSFTDEDNRDICITSYGEGPIDDEFELLRSMYEGWPQNNQSQGIPPITREQTKQWLSNILDGINTIAWYDEMSIGHAMLISDEEAGKDKQLDEHELAVFVRPHYQSAGVGTQLVEGLLAQGYRHGARAIWLTVGSWNDSALNLYQHLGFETTRFIRPNWLEKESDAYIAKMEVKL